MEKRLWKNIFQTETEKTTEFRKAVRDMCEEFINDNDTMRRPLSEGFTKEELEVVRSEAATIGLDVVTHLRYDKEIIYLQKRKV